MAVPQSINQGHQLVDEHAFAVWSQRCSAVQYLSLRVDDGGTHICATNIYADRQGI